MRIVSLLPAATEICFALGLGDRVVGVSPECDHPAQARAKPVLSRAFLREDASGAETSRWVGERLARGEALYAIDADGLRAAAPDLILTQGLCDVCAPSLGDVRDVARRLPGPPEVLSLDPHRLEDIFGDIRRVGETCGAQEAADALLAGLRERIDRVASRIRPATARPATLCLEWLDPLFVAGHWVPEIVEIAGGHDVLGRPGEASIRVEPKAIALAAPEVVVLMPCGFHMDRTIKEAPVVSSQPFWRDLPAVRRDRVWLADGSSYFSRPGPRIVDGLEILAHILHPRMFPRAWRPADVQPWTG